MATSSEVRLGQLLIQKRWCSLKEVNTGLEIQDGLREEGVSRSLVSILIDNRFIEEEKVRVALSILGSLRLFCSSCNLEVPVDDFDPASNYLCPKCQGGLSRRDFIGNPRAAEEAAIGRVDFTAGDPDDSTGTHPAAEVAAFDVPEEEEKDDPIIYRIIGGCQIIHRIAKGGMGVVYKAKQLKLGRPVAVKILSEELARDRNFVHRFLQEARSAAELNHGNIVHIIDVGELNGLFYIIMEFVDGSNLRQILEACSKLDAARAIEICLQASHALKHAHKRGVIHRDIKPENIMITQDGNVKIADLGLAKKIASGEQDGGITNAGAILGTPYYMAPEQVKDFSKVDGRTDMYSLGVTLFRALTGVVPFKGRTPVEVMIHVVDGKRPALRTLNSEISEEVEALVDRMMHRQPERRFQDFEEVINEMESVLHGLRAGKSEGVPGDGPNFDPSNARESVPNR